ncbi:MAG: HlyD family secretion protein [Planctomycetota bacterium]|jgi:HlyD family secretion protein
MSQEHTQVDLSVFARPDSTIQPPRRSPLRILVPLVLLVGFGAVLASTLTDYFKPKVKISVVRPLAPSGDQMTAVGEDSITVQASGWLEADPFAVHVAALADGVIEELFVEEADRVVKNQVIATLIDDDARIARDAAAAELALREAELRESSVRETNAKERLSAALEVTEALAVARASLAGAEAAAKLEGSAVVEGESRVATAESEVVVQRELEDAGANGARQVELAVAAHAEAVGALDGLRAKSKLAESRQLEAIARFERATQDMEQRFDDRLAVDVAKEKVAGQEARVALATAALEQAELRLSRMEIRTPIDGVVLERLTMPGMVVSVDLMGHAVCSLYDPANLRVRVDVPQSDVAGVFVGQRAEVSAETRRGRAYEGEVIRIVRKANLSKVTLEAHVRIKDPDPLLTPEGLAQVRFFGRPQEEGNALEAEGSSASSIVLIPERLLEGNSVWIVAAGGTAEKRDVDLGERSDGNVLVRSGINLTDKLIDAGRNNLQEGDLVVIEEDQ